MKPDTYIHHVSVGKIFKAMGSKVKVAERWS